jgi:hypothetical protein
MQALYNLLIYCILHIIALTDSDDNIVFLITKDTFSFVGRLHIINIEKTIPVNSSMLKYINNVINAGLDNSNDNESLFLILFFVSRNLDLSFYMKFFYSGTVFVLWIYSRGISSW